MFKQPLIHFLYIYLLYIYLYIYIFIYIYLYIILYLYFYFIHLYIKGTEYKHIQIPIKSEDQHKEFVSTMLTIQFYSSSCLRNNVKNYENLYRGIQKSVEFCLNGHDWPLANLSRPTICLCIHLPKLYR